LGLVKSAANVNLERLLTADLFQESAVALFRRKVFSNLGKTSCGKSSPLIPIH
jgi:hypothetical protein